MHNAVSNIFFLQDEEKGCRNDSPFLTSIVLLSDNQYHLHGIVTCIPVSVFTGYIVELNTEAAYHTTVFRYGRSAGQADR